MPPVPTIVRSAEDRDREVREVEDIASERIIATILHYRLRFFPVPILAAAALAWLGPTVWRYALLTLAVLSMASLGLVDRLTRPDAGAARRILVPVWIAGLAQLALVFVMGGIAGPIAIAMPVITIVMNLVAPGRQAIFFVLLAQIPAVWMFATAQAYDLVPELVPVAWHGVYAPPGTPGLGPWMTATFFTVLLLGASGMGRGLRGVILGMLRDKLEDRDRQLGSYEEESRQISQMTAEIAHELKNPLASIKGLAALVRKDLSGQTAERMDVLRREVDRLQSTLEEFLSHSRPLVPIDEEHVDLAELAREVIGLHEGIARQREVKLVPPAGETHLRCDPRKITRVMINLVQNAIEASPRGGEVRVEIERDEAGARVRVIDQGAGLAGDAAAKLFTVGFTTKEEGTGIGLALARGLARQHGGELALANREGARGCVATLSLPNAPPAQVEAA